MILFFPLSRTLRAFAALLVPFVIGAPALAAPIFHSTANPTGNWFVSFAQNPNGDGQLASFSTASFAQAVAVDGRPDFIANNSTGTNGAIGNWSFFVFRQSFDLTGYDLGSVNLQFQWAADDSGEGVENRGTWKPKFTLNGGAFVDWAGPTAFTYDYGHTVTLNSGFVAGLNTVDFYVEGNGVTDGMKLKVLGFTADTSNTGSGNAVPEPGMGLLLLAAVLGLTIRTRSRKTVPRT